MKHDARERFIITARLLLELLLAVVFVVAFDCSHFRMVDRALRRLLELFFDIISTSIHNFIALRLGFLELFLNLLFYFTHSQSYFFSMDLAIGYAIPVHFGMVC